MKLCKDCKWHKAGYDIYGLFDTCHAPQIKPRDISVRGIGKAGDYCDMQRQDGRLLSWIFKTCGRRARWFVPKEKK